VLGAGGEAGIAWEVGLLAGLAERGTDLTAADGSSEARWSTAAVTPARSANGGVPCSNRSGTVPGAGSSLSGCSVSSSPGSATTAPTCGPDHL